MPTDLSTEAKAAWRLLVRSLREDGALHSTDGPLLEAAAVCLGRLREARGLLAREGLTVRGDRGSVVHPALRIELGAIAQLRALLAELGLGPSARARLGLVELRRDSAERELDEEIGPSPRLRAVAGGRRSRKAAK
jgi:P27 family predicted phage terminase small subunit